MIYFLLLLVFCLEGAAQPSNTPIWTTSSFFRAGNQHVITTLTGSSVFPFSSYQFMFSSALPGTPKLGYGMKAYEGNDYLGEEIFQIRRVQLTATFFTVEVQIFAVTNVHKLSVSYIAIDPLFPHLLNSFDNVHINYPNEPIVNISTKNGGSATYYYNTVNYTEQAVGLAYNMFSFPLANHKILLFMTYLKMYGTNSCGAGATDYRIFLEVSAEVKTVDTYLFTVELQINVSLVGLGFSQLIFSAEDVRASLRYMIVHQKLEVDFSMTNFFPIPSQFIDNFIMGFTSFKTPKATTIIDFQWDFQIQGGVHGVAFPVSVATTSYTCGQQPVSIGYFTVFYIKSWICPNDTNYFDPDTEMCIVCPVLGCEICYNSTACHQCFQGFYLDEVSLLCQQCDLSYCQDCLTMTAAEVCSCKFTIKDNSLQYLGCNQLKLVFIPDPILSLPAMQQKILIEHPNISRYQIYKQAESFYALIYIDGDLTDPQLKFTYLPGSVSLVKYSSVIPALYYSQSECHTAEDMKDFVLAVRIVGWIFIVLSLINAKIIGLELGGLLQVAYFSLADQDFFNLYLAPLVALRDMNGLNILLMQEAKTQLPQQISYIGVELSFLNNCNIMVFLLLIELLVSIIVLLIGKITNSKKVSKIGRVLLKQGFLTLIMFNCLNFSFSAGIVWEFGSSGEGIFHIASTIVMYLCLLAIVVTLIGFAILPSKGYGEFKDKFKSGFVCRSYIGVSIVFRVLLGVTMATESNYAEGTLIILLMPLFFFVFVISNLPFKDVGHNYRASFIHFSTIVILLVSNYYRSMKSNTPIAIKSRHYAPALIEIFCIALCIAISAIVLLRDIYKFFKQVSLRGSQKVQNEHIRNPSNETTENIQFSGHD